MSVVGQSPLITSLEPFSSCLQDVWYMPLSVYLNKLLNLEINLLQNTIIFYRTLFVKCSNSYYQYFQWILKLFVRCLFKDFSIIFICYLST